MDSIDIGLYLPERTIYDLKLRVLNEGTKLDAFVTQKLVEALQKPSKLKEIKAPRYGIRITTDVPRDVWKEIKGLSNKTGFSMNAIVFTILSNALAKPLEGNR
jgi:hypothetical protein